MIVEYCGWVVIPTERVKLHIRQTREASYSSFLPTRRHYLFVRRDEDTVSFGGHVQMVGCDKSWWSGMLARKSLPAREVRTCMSDVEANLSVVLEGIVLPWQGSDRSVAC